MCCVIYFTMRLIALSISSPSSSPSSTIFLRKVCFNSAIPCSADTRGVGGTVPFYKGMLGGGCSST